MFIDVAIPCALWLPHRAPHLRLCEHANNTGSNDSVAVPDGPRGNDDAVSGCECREGVGGKTS